MKAEQLRMVRRRLDAGQAMLMLALTVLATRAPLQAADTTNYTWNYWSASTPTNWSLPANWANNALPFNGGGQGTMLLFTNTTYTAITASNDFSIVPFLLTGITLSNINATVTLAGNALQFTASGAGVQPALLQNANQNAPINNGLTLATNLTVGGVGAGTVTLGGVIGGGGGMAKNGSFALALNGNNAYTGGTILNAGTLSLGTNWALGLGMLTVSGGVFQASKPVSLSNDVAIAGESAIGGAANLTLNNILFAVPHTLTNLNSATTTIAGTNGGAGTLFAQAGNLILSNAPNTRGLFLQASGGSGMLVGGGTFGVGFGTLNTNAVASMPGTITLNPLAVGNTSFVFGAVTNGPGAMGTLLVNTGIAGSTNVVSIGTLVRNGRSALAITPQNGLGTREQVSIASGATSVNNILPPWIVSTTNGGEFLASGANGLTNATPTVLWNTANGSNTVVTSASDIVKVTMPTTLTNDIAAYSLNVQNGRLNLNGHTVILGGGAFGGLILTNGMALTNGGTLVLNGTEAPVFVGAGNTAFVAANLAGDGNLTKFGAGTLALTNFGTLYAGDTVVDAGVLSLAPAQDYVYTNNVNGAGMLSKDGPNAFTIVNSTGTLYGVVVNKGMLAFSGGLRNEQFPPNIANSATLLLNNGVQYVNTMTNTAFNVNGLLSLTNSTAAVTFLQSAGNIIVNAGGSVSVGYASWLTTTNGGVTVNGGNLNIGTPGTPGSLSANGGGLTMSGNGSMVVVTNGSLLAQGLTLSGGYATLVVYSNGILNLKGGLMTSLSSKTNTVTINGGILTNLTADSSGSFTATHLPCGDHTTLNIVNGGTLYAPTNSNFMVGGWNVPGYCSFSVGGAGLVSTAYVGTVLLGGRNDTSVAGASFNQMIVSNGTLYSAGATIGYNVANTSGSTRSNSVSVLNGGYWNVGGSLTIGSAMSANSPSLQHALTVNGGIATNVTALIVGSGAACSNNSATIMNGGLLYATSVTIGSPSSNNTVLVTSGGLLEAASSLSMGPAAGGNAFTNAGGVLQFTNATPAIAANGNAVINNGIVSFRAATNVVIFGNWYGSQLTNLTFTGNNGFRLCASTNAAGTNQTYVFDPNLGATNYARLEMVGGSTCYRGQSTNCLTIGQYVGSGGQMLCSNTAALVTIPFTNNGTLTVVNSTLTLAANAVLNGAVTIDMNHLVSTNGLLLASNLTLGANSSLNLTGAITNLTLAKVSSTLSGQFGFVSGLPSSYVISYKSGQISLVHAPGTSVILFQ